MTVLSEACCSMCRFDYIGEKTASVGPTWKNITRFFADQTIAAWVWTGVH